MTDVQLAALSQAFSFLAHGFLTFLPPGTSEAAQAADTERQLFALLGRLSSPGYRPTPPEVDNCRLALQVYISAHPADSAGQREALFWLERNFGVLR